MVRPPPPEHRLGDSSTTESTETDSSQPAGDSVKSVSPPRLPDEDVLSLHDDGLTGRLTFEARHSWSGEVIDDQGEDPLVGTTLHDTYFVSRIIGEGGMGRVYEARHTRIASKRYAIKVLHAEFARSAEVRSRFQHEAEAAATIEHPGVVGTYDVGETPGGGPYMVCEYLAGEDLNDYLTERGALPARTVVHIGRQLCSALGAAHARGVIHRDLKPHNVFVIGQEGVPSGRSEPGESSDLPSVKVLDFGLSRFIERDNDLTKTGIILGTPSYMAPEQAGGLSTDLRTDIYGIGALLYALATGRAPFKEDSPQKTVLAVLSQAPTRPRDLVASIPTPLEIVIQRAMARDPGERYQSAEEMALSLAELDGASTPLNRRISLSQRAPPSAPRLQFSLYALAGLVLGGVSSCLALLSLLEARGIDYRSFRPSVLEWLLFALLSLVLLFPLGLLAGRFKRRVWNDSARVADLVPKFKRPIVAATLAYGVSSVVAFSAWATDGLRSGGLAHAPSGSTLDWYFVLPLNALLAASAVLIRDGSQKVQSPFVRALSGAGYSAGAAVAGIFLLVLAIIAPTASPVSAPHAPSIPDLARDGRSAKTVQPEPSPATVPPAPSTKDPKATDGEAREPSEDAQSRSRAPQEDLAMASERGPEALERLLLKFPRDGNILEALVLAYASRADTFDRSVEAISRLLEVEPEFVSDPDVLFILKKGLFAQGKAHAAAFDIVKNQMGTEGGELVYQLLNENPKQRERLKNVLFELRKGDHVSPATAIAYDLRYTTSCRGRLAHLERAEKVGDIRSLNQLRALSTAPKRCGWGKKCQPPCPAEAQRFRESIEIIQSRLAGR